MKRLINFCMLCFLCLYTGLAQEVLQKHTVSQGETIIQISKKYNVTPYEIQQANKETLKSLDDIKVDDILIIPKSKINTPQLESKADAIKNTAAATAAKTITYTVLKGETKYGLSKRFNTTIPELEAQNPHIVPGLNEGHILKINTSVDTATMLTNTVQDKAPIIQTDGYKDHLVLKGETLWGISHSNGLTVEQLVAANTDVLDGILKEGQTLRVPQIKQDGFNNETYFVKYGDTKYSLAKKYKTTIEELERLNPHIVRMLQAGHTIRIPLTANNGVITQNDPDNSVNTDPKPEAAQDDTESPSTSNVTEIVNNEPTETTTLDITENNISSVANSDENNQEPSTSQTTSTDAYVSYEIKPKETLYGLSKQAGMSTEEFLKLNPQLRESVQIGTIIKMPKNSADLSQQPMNTPTNPTISSSTRYKDLTLSINRDTKKSILIFLPFPESQFNQEFSGLGKGSISNEFKKEHLEFYSGAKLAMDSLKKIGLNVDLTIFELENKSRKPELTNLNTNQNLNTYHALLLPFYNGIEEEVATKVSVEQIPVISASTVVHEKNVDNLFEAVPSINQQRQKVLDFIISKQANIIVVNDVNRPESKEFIENHVPYAKFVDLKKNGSFKENDLISHFDKDKVNYVILDSERNSVFLNVTNILLSELSNYNLQLAVLESSLIPDNDDVSVKRFRILKMIFPSLVSPESNYKLENFSKVYEKTYNLQPSQNAIFGFDITFDTLLRLSQQKSFISSARNDVTEYVKLKFDYGMNSFGGYGNNGIYILQYDTNTTLQEAN